MMVGHHSRVEDLELIPETRDRDKSVNEVLGVNNQDRMGRALGCDQSRIVTKGYHRMAMGVKVDCSSHTNYGTKQEIGRYRSLSVQRRVAD
jgi:hypothetical protein